MTTKQALALVKKNGIMLESGRGPVPSLAQMIAGEPIRGSWWSHPKGRSIFRCSRAVRDSSDVVVCRLIGGKVTYVHRRLWPALVRLAEYIDVHSLAAIREAHTTGGKHEIGVTAFPDWVPAPIMAAAANLTAEQASRLLPDSLGLDAFSSSAGPSGGPPPSSRRPGHRTERGWTR